MKKYIAKTFQGLEGILETELHQIGIPNTTQLNRSVAFECSFDKMMEANLSLRTAIRIYAPILEFDVRDEQDLYQKLYAYSWEPHLKMEQTFAIESIVVSPHFNNSHFIALKSKDAIADYFSRKYGKRPSVDVRWPNVRFQVYISKANKCVVSIDTTGEPLYKRGYKKRQTEASINECLAAGLILRSGYHGQHDFYDMMCGSGTLTAEALMIASHFPPNLFKEKWPFYDYKEFNLAQFKSIQNKLKENVILPEVDFYLNDKSTQALDIAKMNIFDLKVNTDRVQFSRDDFFEITPKTKGTLIINPPYNERLELKEEDLWYKDMGDMLKRNYQGFDVWVISSNKNGMKKIGLKPTTKLSILNGPIPCEYCQYEMY